tara:strand:+ start:2215 stop:2535 length:321 start_codon:yes stop_codon:yes gene_type:complete
MWKSILSKVNAALLTHWSQLVWFVIGALVGTVLLGGLVSCRTVEKTWEGTKGTGAAILGGAESVLDAGYQGAKAVGSAALGTVEGAVEGVVEDATKAVTIVTGEKK